MWRGLPLVLAATALCLPAQVLADEVSPSEWLERMTTSLHAESYQGTFVLQRDDRIDTIRVVHVADDGGYRERLETLTGAEREILRSVDRLSAIKGARGASGDGAQSPLGPAGAPVSLLETHDLYALKIQGLDRVAGYPCTLIMARDGARAGCPALQPSLLPPYGQRPAAPERAVRSQGQAAGTACLHRSGVE